MADFSEETKLAVWNKAQTVGNNNPAVWRKDQCGAWIGWKYYGDRTSQYGWEIDTLFPFPRVVLIICPTFDHFSGRTMHPDKMTVCAAKSLLRGTIT